MLSVHWGPTTYVHPRGPERNCGPRYSANRLKIRHPFVPPNPNEFDNA